MSQPGAAVQWSTVGTYDQFNTQNDQSSRRATSCFQINELFRGKKTLLTHYTLLLRKKNSQDPNVFVCQEAFIRRVSPPSR